MTMSPTLVESIKRRAADEAERDSYPAGFPVLPPVPAGRYADPAWARVALPLQPLAAEPAGRLREALGRRAAEP